MKVTPWKEARRQAVAEAAFNDHDTEAAVTAALTTLSRLGYRIVPAEAAEEMVKAGVKSEPFCSFSMINAATEAGDVLRGEK